MENGSSFLTKICDCMSGPPSIPNRKAPGSDGANSNASMVVRNPMAHLRPSSPPRPKDSVKQSSNVPRTVIVPPSLPPTLTRPKSQAALKQEISSSMLQQTPPAFSSSPPRLPREGTLIVDPMSVVSVPPITRTASNIPVAFISPPRGSSMSPSRARSKFPSARRVIASDKQINSPRPVVPERPSEYPGIRQVASVDMWGVPPVQETRRTVSFGDVQSSHDSGNMEIHSAPAERLQSPIGTIQKSAPKPSTTAAPLPSSQYWRANNVTSNWATIAFRVELRVLPFSAWKNVNRSERMELERAMLQEEVHGALPEGTVLGKASIRVNIVDDATVKDLVVVEGTIETPVNKKKEATIEVCKFLQLRGVFRAPMLVIIKGPLAAVKHTSSGDLDVHVVFATVNDVPVVENGTSMSPQRKMSPSKCDLVQHALVVIPEPQKVVESHHQHLQHRRQQQHSPQRRDAPSQPSSRNLVQYLHQHDVVGSHPVSIHTPAHTPYTQRLARSPPTVDARSYGLEDLVQVVEEPMMHTNNTNNGHPYQRGGLRAQCKAIVAPDPYLLVTPSQASFTAWRSRYR